MDGLSEKLHPSTKTPVSVDELSKNRLPSTKLPRLVDGATARQVRGLHVGFLLTLPLEFLLDLRPERQCPKCAKEFFNRFRNYMKSRDLAYKNFGRKCVKFFQKVFAIQKKLLPLQPIN